MSKVNFYFLFTLFLFSCNNEILDHIDFKNPVINEVLSDWKKYNTQIILTEISRNSDGKISFKDYNLSVDDELYFYPASTVKLPVALLTLQYITSLNESEEIIKSLTVSEAIMLMDLNDQNAIFFKNTKNKRLNILFKRLDGNIGWLDPKKWYEAIRIYLQKFNFYRRSSR